MTAWLSPDGLNVYRESQPVTRLLVGNTNGISIAEREAAGANWRMPGRVL